VCVCVCVLRSLVDLLIPEDHGRPRKLVTEGLVVVLPEQIHVVLGKDLEEVFEGQLLAGGGFDLGQRDLSTVEVHRRHLGALNEVIEGIVTCPRASFSLFPP